MIVQITLIKNEFHLLKKLLPIWKEYADGFIFLSDTSTDESVEYLNQVKDQFNILEIIEISEAKDKLKVETDMRQLLFDTALKYSNKIICLDADEYLDGEMSKKELETLLTQSPDTVFHLQWVQYTSCNTIRTDGPWKNNFKDRIGCYSKPTQFQYAQMHSTHLPIPENQLALDPTKLFIAHMQWIDKTFVAIKQYFWKVMDYVNSKIYNIETAGVQAYDSSINNFEWEEEYTFNPLKINPTIFKETSVYNNYRLKYIKEQTKLHNIPNLGDWGYDILNLDETTPPLFNPYKISVITAIGPLEIYGKFIPRYLDNVTDQHFFHETEHIIIYSEWDDILNEFLKYPNFTLIKEDERKGVYNAWNIGIKAATTEYVTNWNIDDLRHPINNKIKYDAITQNNYDVIYNWYIATSDENENFYNLDLSTKTILQYPDNYENYVLHNCYAGPDPLWKKSLHDKVGYFDYENFNTIGDWEMWIRFAKSGAKFKLIPEALCLYYDHDQTVSQRQSEKVQNEKNKLFQKYN
jgi:hypothetical protein